MSKVYQRNIGENEIWSSVVNSKQNLLLSSKNNIKYKNYSKHKIFKIYKSVEKNEAHKRKNMAVIKYVINRRNISG